MSDEAMKAAISRVSRDDANIINPLIGSQEVETLINVTNLLDFVQSLAVQEEGVSFDGEGLFWLIHPMSAALRFESISKEVDHG